MTAFEGDPFQRWEEEVREASLRGIEGVLPPPAKWESFLGAAVSDFYTSGTGLPWETAMESVPGIEPVPGMESVPGMEPVPEMEPPPGPTADSPAQEDGQPTEISPLASPDAPDAQLPENLRAEIEGFLNPDRPTQASDSEVKDFLKGGIDPNMDPEK